MSGADDVGITGTSYKVLGINIEMNLRYEPKISILDLRFIS